MNIQDFDFRNYLEEGDIIKGFCNGFFGRDDYNNKIVVEVKKDYVLFAYEEYTALEEEEQGRIDIREYIILSLPSFISYDQETHISTLKTYLKFEDMFNQWKKGDF